MLHADFFNKCKNNITLFTSLRLYRNLANKRFSKYANKEELYTVEKSINNILSKDETYKLIKVQELENEKQNSLRDTLLIKKSLRDTSIYTSNNKDIIINLDEHITIQVIENSLSLKKAYDTIKKEEKKLSDKIEFAFDNELGFLTSTPKKVGSSMSILIAFLIPSVMVFAPNMLENFENEAKKNGFTVKIKDNILYLRNKIMIGSTDIELLKTAYNISKYIIKTEVSFRERLLKNYRAKLENKIFRAYAILKSAKLLSYSESIKYLMWLNLGISLSIIKINKEIIYKLIFLTKKSQIIEYYNSDVKNTKEYRANLIQEYLKD